LLKLAGAEIHNTDATSSMTLRVFNFPHFGTMHKNFNCSDHALN